MDANSGEPWSELDLDDLESCLDYCNSFAAAASMLCRRRCEGGEVLVSREGKAATAPLGQLVALAPAEALGRQRDDVAGSRVLQMAQAKLDRIGTRRLGQFIHKALDREHVHIRAKGAKG
jgi:hypothetical protein